MISLNYCSLEMYERPDPHSRVAERPGDDWRLVFAEDTRAAFAEPSRHGVNRNVRFAPSVNHLAGAFAPGGALEGQWEVGPHQAPPAGTARL